MHLILVTLMLLNQLLDERERERDLVGWSHDSGRSCIHDYVGSRNWTYWVKQRTQGGWVGRRSVGKSGGSGKNWGDDE